MGRCFGKDNKMINNARMKIIINAIIAKKGAGGAYQISSNFISESLEHSDVEWYWFVSKDLDAVLGDKFKEYKDMRYFVFPTQPDFKHSYFRVRRQLKELEKSIKPDLIYSITAPSYFKFSTPEVMRFTNPYITHLNKYAWSMVPSKRKIRDIFYIAFQKRLIRGNKYFVTQSQTCKEGIIKITGTGEDNVKVVSNVLPAAYRSASREHLPGDEGWIDVACIGAPFFHKNFDILPEVLLELQKMGIENIRFQVTIPQDNPLYVNMVKQLENYGLSDCVVSHGRCTQQHLADVYRRCRLCYQPTTLEVFSASAIEAMYFQLPTVATALPFNQEVFKESCLYCEPCNARSAALQFARLAKDKSLQNVLCQRMESRLDIYGDYGNHFTATKEFLLKVATNHI